MEVCGTADTVEKAIMLAQQHRPILVLMDMCLRGRQDGIDATLAINAMVGSKMIFIIGSREADTLKRIELAHPSAVLFKPISFRQLQCAVKTG